MIENLDNNTILICNSADKKKVLNYYYDNNKLIDFKIMSISEFIDNITYTYDTKAIYYVMQKYNVKYDVAMVYLNNIKYVDKRYDNEKILFIYELKEELLKENLLKENKLFKKYIKNKKIIFYNINYDMKYLKHICFNLNVSFVNESISKEYSKKIYNFFTIQDEINYVGNSIISLIEQGMDISKIKLVNISSDYNYSLKLIFDLLGLKININDNYIYATVIGKYFLSNLSPDINETIHNLKEKYDSPITNQIVDICNNYTWCHNFNDIKELLVYDLKNTKIKKEKLNNEIEIIDIFDIDDNSDNYYFLMNFNNESIPKIYKDTEYINDTLCSILNKETSNDRFLREKNIVLNKIKKAKNMIITYKDNTYFGEYMLSNLNDDLNYEIEKNINLDISYSKLLSKLSLAQELDLYSKYGEKTSKLVRLYNSINCDYKTYDNNFTSINVNSMYELLDNKITLSYSAIDTYYKCAYKFYINNILKIKDDEKNFVSYMGSLMHYVLSCYSNEGFRINVEINNYLKDHPIDISSKEEFFLNKVKEYLEFIIKIINKQKLITGFNNELYEKPLFIYKNNKIKITFMGIIDKIMYLNKNGNTYLSIIDYKSGDIDTNLRHVDIGLDLQLPTYAYLINESHEFENPIICGLYYQKLLDNDIDATTSENYEMEKSKNLRLQGLSINDESILEVFDSTYEQSELIKGLRLTKTGLSGKVFSKTEMIDIVKHCEKKIDEAIDKIVNGNFDINPKKIKNDNVSCKYCKYRDICFMNEDNVVIVEEGDTDAELD